jgi:hypothetical protein
MIFHEWKEFVVYPLDSGRAHTLEQRLDTSRAFRIGPDGQYPPEYSEAGVDRAAVIPLSTFLSGNDAFECMEIDDSGWVVIWTKRKVWFLAREGNDWRIEKLRCVPRNPPETKGVA